MVALGGGLVEAAEDDLGQAAGAGQGFGDRRDRDHGGLVGRVAEDAGRDRREGDGGERVLLHDLQRAAVAGGEHFGLAAAPAVPDRADGVDDVERGQAVARGDFRVSRGAVTQRRAFLRQFRPGGAVDGAADPAAGGECVVGGVDDSVDRQRGDVALVDDDAMGHGSCLGGCAGRSVAPPSLPLPPEGRGDACSAVWGMGGRVVMAQSSHPEHAEPGFPDGCVECCSQR